jgi:DNA-binding winged helix-turn-helix (wHTH) protein
MRTDHTSRNAPDRMDSPFVRTDSRTSEPRSASIHFPDPSTRSGQHRGFVPNIEMPPTLRNGMAEFLVDIDGLHIVVRFLVKELFAEMQSSFVAKDADIRSLLSSTLERMVDRMRGSSLRSDDPSKQPLAIVELISNGGSLIRRRAQPNETVLRVGSLELDLIDRSAKRGDRQIDLRSREFQLLKYMMQRSGQLLTRATLFKEVWHYKFDPETNLVDVHMGRLRRKVDGSNEAPMIRNVRGAGFVLSANPISQGPPTRPLNDQPIWPSEKGLRGQWKGDCNDN